MVNCHWLFSTFQRLKFNLDRVTSTPVHLANLRYIHRMMPYTPTTIHHTYITDPRTSIYQLYCRALIKLNVVVGVEHDQAGQRGKGYTQPRAHALMNAAYAMQIKRRWPSQAGGAAGSDRLTSVDAFNQCGYSCHMVTTNHPYMHGPGGNHVALQYVGTSPFVFSQLLYQKKTVHLQQKTIINKIGEYYLN